MKNVSFSFLLFLCLGITLVSCKKDKAEPEAIVINATDFSVGLPNNMQNGTVVGTVSATTNSGTLTYAISSQQVTGALAINATTGQIIVATAGNIYLFYCGAPNPRPAFFTATITISNGSTSKIITLTVSTTGLLCGA